MSDFTRRGALTLATTLPLLSSVFDARPASAQTTTKSQSSTLVAYFSRTGNTRVLANQIRRATAADMFEINPAEPYPEDYEQTVRQAQGERDAGFEPRLQDIPPAVGGYDTVFLGFPIWGTTAPPVVRSFLSTADLSGTRLVPFITHGGYGLGSSLSVLRTYAPNAQLVEGFTLEADQERRTLELVTGWLGDLSL